MFLLYLIRSKLYFFQTLLVQRVLYRRSDIKNIWRQNSSVLGSHLQDGVEGSAHETPP